MRKILLSLLLWSLWSTAYAQPDFLVDADWLAEHIEDEKLVVLEVCYHPHRYYTVGHIPGAVQVQRLDQEALIRTPATRASPTSDWFA